MGNVYLMAASWMWQVCVTCNATMPISLPLCRAGCPAGGLACLCGAAGRWVIRRTAISIGRSSDSKGDVDVDLGKAAPQAAVAAAAPPSAAAGGTTAAAAGATTPAAGPAAAAADGFGSAGAGGAASGAAAGGLRSVSRLQAQLSLRLDGCWTLRNTGRAAMAVNGKKVSLGL